MSELGALDVVWNTANLLGDRGDLVRRHINKFGAGIDEARDQPRTSNAIDLRMFAGNPFIIGPAAKLSSRGQFHFLPGRNTSFEVCRLDVGGAQRLRYALADVTAVAAIVHNRATDGQIPRQPIDFFGSMTERADDLPIIGVEGVLATDIHQNRR